MDSERLEIEAAVIKSVTSPATIKRLAEEHKLNPQEVFVRIVFSYEGKEYMASNQLRFFGETGYQKLLDAKATGGAVKLALTHNAKGSFVYLESDEAVEVKDLFKDPIAKTNTYTDVENLF